MAVGRFALGKATPAVRDAQGRYRVQGAGWLERPDRGAEDEEWGLQHSDAQDGMRADEVDGASGELRLQSDGICRQLVDLC